MGSALTRFWQMVIAEEFICSSGTVVTTLGKVSRLLARLEAMALKTFSILIRAQLGAYTLMTTCFPDHRL